MQRPALGSSRIGYDDPRKQIERGSARVRRRGRGIRRRGHGVAGERTGQRAGDAAGGCGFADPSAARGGRARAAVAITAYARSEDEARVRDAGFQRHVAKPFDPETLVRTVRELVSS